MSQAWSDFGGELRQARERNGLSLADLSHVTKIPLRSLDYLETGRFSELPAQVFVRGFVRAYARAVGLDPVDAVKRHEQAMATAKSRGTAPRGDDGPRCSSDGQAGRALAGAGHARRRAPIALAVIVLVLALTLAVSFLLGRGTRADAGGVVTAGDAGAPSPPWLK